VSSSKRKENEAGSLDPSRRLLLQDCGGMLPRRDRRHGCETQDQENARRITHRQRHRPAARIWAQARGSAVDGAPSPQSHSDSVEVPCATPTFNVVGAQDMEEQASGVPLGGSMQLHSKVLGKPPVSGARPPLPTSKQPVSFPDALSLNLAYISDRGRTTPASFTPSSTPHGAPTSAMRYGMMNRTGCVCAPARVRFLCGPCATRQGEAS
jgi:hypothetical protein